MIGKPSEEIKERLDIVDLISEYIQLTPAGVNNFKARCPFHNEKTPSLFVSKDKQIFKCFGCFPKGAIIRTVEGNKAIDRLKIGDLVLTHKSRYKPVIKLFKRDYKGLMVDVITRKLNEVVSLTSDHKVFVIKTINCKQKNRESRICQLRCTQNCPTKYFKDYKIKKILAGELKQNDYLLYPIDEKVVDIKKINLKKYLTKKKPIHGKEIRKLPDYLTVNSDLLKLLGYWIAEGSSHRAYIRFSLGNHEEIFANDIVKLLFKVFKLKASIYRRKNTEKTGLEITCCNSNLANIFENLCGKGALNKHIPFEFVNLLARKQRILLEAIHRGDGYQGFVNDSKRKYRAITVISRTLTDQMKEILLRLNLMPTLFIADEKVDKKGVRHKKSYTLSWQENILGHYADFYRFDKIKYWILPIRKIVKRKFSGTVYNLMVKDDHSYTTTNFTVGNCGEGGDVFSFVMKMEGLEFVDALRILAVKAGVELKREQPEFYSKRARVLEILKLSAEYYNLALLKSKSGQIARDYIATRKLKSETVSQFKLGFSPDDWEMLSRFLKSRGFRDDEILASGMVVPKDYGRYYDRFRFRLMFPIWDGQNNVVGFTARQLREEKNMGKYINTSQSLVYDKSRVIYGLNFAKSDIRREDRVVIVEGNMDVIASHQAGVKNVVASSGTALTSMQIDLIKRYTNNVVFSFDMDLAGNMATQRGIDLALESGLNIKVAVPKKNNDVKDPDDIIKTEGVKAWKDVINSAKSIMDYYFESNAEKLNLTEVLDKKIMAKFLLPKIKKIPDKVEQAHYLQKLAGLLLVGEDILREAMGKTRVLHGYGRSASAKASAFAPTVVGASTYANASADKPVDKESETELLQERLFGLIMSDFENFKKLESFDLGLFNDQISSLYKRIKEYYNDNKSFEFNVFSSELEKDSVVLSLFAKELVLGIEKEQSQREKGEIFEIKKEVDRCLNRLTENDLKKRLMDIEAQMRNAEVSKNVEKVTDLSKQFNVLSQKLDKVNEII